MEVVAARIKDMPGKRFSRLTVIREVAPLVHYTEKRRVAVRMFECKCDCGTVKTIRMFSLRNGSTLSCGCYHNEMSVLQARKHGDASHEYKAVEYTAWLNMKKRCESPKCSRFKDYGGRGIAVCERWRNSYKNFIADMGRKPSPMHSIDRINNDGNYEPGNCRWALPKEQARNNSRNRHVSFEGRSMPLSEACELTGLPYDIVKARLRRGWTDERALVK